MPHLRHHGAAWSRGNEVPAVVPFVDSKGLWQRPTAGLCPALLPVTDSSRVCGRLFRDIDKGTVDCAQLRQHHHRPTPAAGHLPTILANNTLGIAVGMAYNICSFNLAELCATTVALMKDERHDISPHHARSRGFVGGGQILYDEAQMREIYENSRGGVIATPATVWCRART